MATVPRVPVKPALRALFGVLVLETILGVAAGGMAGWPSWKRLAALGAVRGLQTLAVLIVFVRETGHLGDLGLRKEDIRPGLVRGLIWSLAFGGLVLAAFGGFMLAGIDPLPWLRVRPGAALPDQIALFLVGGLAGPLAEEVVFRGVLYGLFRPWGVAIALGASTAVFVLLHGAGGGFVQAVGGLLFALAYEREGKLMTPVAIHVLGNCALFSLSFVS